MATPSSATPPLAAGTHRASAHKGVGEPNPYEAPSCQETNYPCERFFRFFSAFGFRAL